MIRTHRSRFVKSRYRKSLAKVLCRKSYVRESVLRSTCDEAPSPINRPPRLFGPRGHSHSIPQQSEIPPQSHRRHSSHDSNPTCGPAVRPRRQHALEAPRGQRRERGCAQSVARRCPCMAADTATGAGATVSATRNPKAHPRATKETARTRARAWNAPPWSSPSAAATDAQRVNVFIAREDEARQRRLRADAASAPKSWTHTRRGRRSYASFARREDEARQRRLRADAASAPRSWTHTRRGRRSYASFARSGPSGGRTPRPPLPRTAPPPKSIQDVISPSSPSPYI